MSARGKARALPGVLPLLGEPRGAGLWGAELWPGRGGEAGPCQGSAAAAGAQGLWVPQQSAGSARASEHPGSGPVEVQGSGGRPPGWSSRRGVRQEGGLEGLCVRVSQGVWR